MGLARLFTTSLRPIHYWQLINYAKDLTRATRDISHLEPDADNYTFDFSTAELFSSELPIESNYDRTVLLLNCIVFSEDHTIKSDLINEAHQALLDLIEKKRDKISQKILGLVTSPLN